MEQFQTKVTTIVEMLGLSEPSVDFDLENRKISIFVNESEWIKEWLPSLVGELDHVIKLLAKKENAESIGETG